MHNKLILAILICFVQPFTGAAQSLFVVKGKINSSVDYQQITLVNPISGDTISRAPILDNSYTLSGQLKEPTLLVAYIEGIPRPLQMYIYNETVDMNVYLQDTFAVDITGSDYHQEYKDFDQYVSSRFTELNRLIGMYNEGVHNRDSVMYLYTELIGRMETEVKDAVANKPNSAILPLMVLVCSDLFEWAYEDYKALFDTFTPAVQQSEYGKELAKMVEMLSIGQIGTVAPNFSQTNEEGKTVSLSDFRGKYVLIDFWASWCGPCRIENPNIVASYHQFKDKNFTVLGISLDNDKTKWLEAIKSDGLEWKHVSDLKGWENAVARQYGVTSIPFSLILDPDGKVIAKNLRGEDLKAFLQELLRADN